MNNAWIIEHGNIDEHVFVITADRTATRLFAITVYSHGPLVATHMLETVGNE